MGNPTATLYDNDSSPQVAGLSPLTWHCGLVYFRMFFYLCIIFSRPFAVFLIRLRSGGGKRRVGNGTGGK